MSWRKRLPPWLRRGLHRVWPERWTQTEIDEIHRRAAEMAARFGTDENTSRTAAAGPGVVQEAPAPENSGETP